MSDTRRRVRIMVAPFVGTEVRVRQAGESYNINCAISDRERELIEQMKRDLDLPNSSALVRFALNYLWTEMT